MGMTGLFAMLIGRGFNEKGRGRIIISFSCLKSLSTKLFDWTVCPSHKISLKAHRYVCAHGVGTPIARTEKLPQQ